ncbi:MAG: winged helix-turn-helix domain-containing protein [Alphaproteobacteria bacterium]
MTNLIRNRDARRLFLHLQGLSRPPRERLSRDGLRDLIEQIGFVQIDSINTVERAHHQILFSRNQTYRQKHLKALHERDRAVFENWTHDAALIPCAFYPYWQHRFMRERERLRARWRKWHRDDFEDHIDSVRARIDREGPTMSRDLVNEGRASGEARAGTGWWDWHPAKTALEYLWRTGEIAVVRREGFQKVYDLCDRAIPEAHRTREVSRSDHIDWACRSALDRLGFATPGELAAFWDAVSSKEAAQWCAARLGGDLIEVEVEPADGGKPRACFAAANFREQVAQAADPPSRLRVLSPFDPVLRDRARTERLFGYRYRIEVFVPAAKREYGYYVFPLLEGSRLIGRIDMKHERQKGTLRIKGLWLESSMRLTAARERRLCAELERVRKFTGADRVIFDDGYDKTVR